MDDAKKEALLTLVEIGGDLVGVPGLSLVALAVITGAELYLFTGKGEEFPVESKVLCDDLERFVAVLIVIYKEVFEPLDEENPARAICGALVSHLAAVLENVIIHRLPKGLITSEESFNQNRAMKQSAAYSGVKSMDSDESDNEDWIPPQSKKSLFDNARKKAASGFSTLKNGGVRAAQKVSGMVPSRNKRTMIDTNLLGNYSFHGFNLNEKEQVITALKLYHYEHVDDATVGNRLRSLLDPLHHLFQDGVSDANFFFGNFCRPGETPIQFKKAFSTNTLRAITKFDKFQQQIQLSFVALNELVNCHEKVVFEDYGGGAPLFEKNEKFVLYFKALRKARKRINPFIYANLSIVGAFTTTERRRNHIADNKSLLHDLTENDQESNTLWTFMVNVLCELKEKKYGSFNKANWKKLVESKNNRLHIAAKEGNLEKCRSILAGKFVDKRKYVNAKGDNGNRPLHFALQSRSEDLVAICSLLKQHGANANVTNKDSITPLHIAQDLPLNHMVIEVLNSNPKID